MNGRKVSRWLAPLLFVLAVALLKPTSASSQVYKLAGCMSTADAPNVILTAKAGIRVTSDSDQNLETCAKFCATGVVESYASLSGNHAQFLAERPYPFSLIQGGWCNCGRTVNGTRLPDAQCSVQADCLKDPTRRCQQRGQGQGYMVYSVDWNAQPAPKSETGASTQPPPPPPPPPSANRPPNPPTVPPGSYEPPFPTQYEGAIQLTWQNNGDPDGDALTFGVFAMQYDFNAGGWVPVPSFRDQSGNTIAAWTTDTVYTFTTQAGLRPATSYAWTVIACEVGRTADQQCAWSGWSVFRTQ